MQPEGPERTLKEIHALGKEEFLSAELIRRIEKHYSHPFMIFGVKRTGRRDLPGLVLHNLRALRRMGCLTARLGHGRHRRTVWGLVTKPSSA